MILNFSGNSAYGNSYIWFVSVYEANPPLNVVQRFVHLLDTSDADYAEELGKLNCVSYKQG